MVGDILFHQLDRPVDVSFLEVQVAQRDEHRDRLISRIPHGLMLFQCKLETVVLKVDECEFGFPWNE